MFSSFLLFQLRLLVISLACLLLTSYTDDPLRSLTAVNHLLRSLEYILTSEMFPRTRHSDLKKILSLVAQALAISSDLPRNSPEDIQDNFKKDKFRHCESYRAPFGIPSHFEISFLYLTSLLSQLTPNYPRSGQLLSCTTENLLPPRNS